MCYSFPVSSSSPKLRHQIFVKNNNCHPSCKNYYEFIAAVKFCGSGGGVVAVPESVDDLDVLERVYADAGFAILRPTVTRGGTAGGT